MGKKIILENISIRTGLNPGDIGFVNYLHGYLIAKEFGLFCDTYIAEGLIEFYNNYDKNLDKVWICEYERKIIGSIFLMHRDNLTAQLRYFILEPEFRGIGLGSKLMNLYMEFFHHCRYKKSYLWTINEFVNATNLYKKTGFKLTEEKESDRFGKRTIEQRYDLLI